MKLHEILTEADDVKSDQLIKAYQNMAEQQRHGANSPEDIMVEYTEFVGGGVMSFCLEHVGDLTWRLGFEYNGKGAVSLDRNKIYKTLESLNSRNFIFSVKDDLQNSARRKNMSVDDMLEFDRKKRYEYALAHSKITVFNEISLYCRDAAVSLGLAPYDGPYTDTKNYLNKLYNIPFDDLADMQSEFDPNFEQKNPGYFSSRASP